MKKIILILAVVTSLSCTPEQKSEFSKEAMAEELTTLNNETITFGQIIENNTGKPVVIEVWASWCGDCVKSMPQLKKLQSDNPDVEYIFVSMDKTADKWKAGVEKHELKGQHYWAPDGMKGAFGTAINLDWIPRYIVVDKEGKVALYRAIETDFEKIDSVLKNLK